MTEALRSEIERVLSILHATWEAGGFPMERFDFLVTRYPTFIAMAVAMIHDRRSPIAQVFDRENPKL